MVGEYGFPCDEQYRPAHTFPPEAVEAGLNAYRALNEREKKAEAWMSDPNTPEDKKLAEFFRYYAEIVCARFAYRRLFRGMQIDFDKEDAE